MYDDDFSGGEDFLSWPSASSTCDECNVMLMCSLGDVLAELCPKLVNYDYLMCCPGEDQPGSNKPGVE